MANLNVKPHPQAPVTSISISRAITSGTNHLPISQAQAGQFICLNPFLAWTWTLHLFHYQHVDRVMATAVMIRSMAMIYRHIVNCGANVSPCNKLPYSLTWPTWHFPKACLKSRMCKSFIHCNCLDCPQNCHFVQLPRMCPFRASNDPSSVFFYRGKTLPQPCLFSLNFYCSFFVILRFNSLPLLLDLRSIRRCPSISCWYWQHRNRKTDKFVGRYSFFGSSSYSLLIFDLCVLFLY